MGGRLGARMEKVTKKQEDSGPAFSSSGAGATNMQLRGEEESVFADDDEPIADDDGMYSNRKHLNPPKNMIDREPEREPDYSCVEANISHSLIENEKALG